MQNKRQHEFVNGWVDTLTSYVLRRTIERMAGPEVSGPTRLSVNVLPIHRRSFLHRAVASRAQWNRRAFAAQLGNFAEEMYSVGSTRV